MEDLEALREQDSERGQKESLKGLSCGKRESVALMQLNADVKGESDSRRTMHSIQMEVHEVAQMVNSVAVDLRKDHAKNQSLGLDGPQGIPCSR